MTRPNSHDRTYQQLFAGVDPQGDFERAYVALTLKLLAALDQSPIVSGPDESVRVVESLVGSDSLAAKHFKNALNTASNRYASGH